MQTVLFKNIGEFKIITGFGKLNIDKVETEKIIESKIKKSEENKRINNLFKQIDTLNKAIKSIHPIISQCQNIRSIENLNLPDDKKSQAIKYFKEKIEIGKKLAELTEKQIQEKKALFLKHAVYFQPTAYEEIKTDEEIQQLKDKLRGLHKNQLLDINGNIIWNYTGLTFWIKKDKWKNIEYNLGEKKEPAAKIYQELSDEERIEISEQIDKERIESLSKDEKEIEKKKLIEQITISAVNKKIGYEIQGDSSKKALEKSQRWFKEKLKKIEEKYG